jgi:hypothetical protein
MRYDFTQAAVQNDCPFSLDKPGDTPDRYTSVNTSGSASKISHTAMVTAKTSKYT